MERKVPPKWSVFISGRGSNLAAALDLRPWMDIRLVVSSSANSYGVLRARRAGIPVLVLDKKINWNQLHVQLQAYGVDHIFLAGFMRLIPGHFVQLWQGRILNIHPSLLPLYPGLDSIQRAYADQEAIGVTLHVVTEEMDAGPIIRQKKIGREGGLLAANLEEAQLHTHLTEHQMVREVFTKWYWNRKL